MPSETGLFSVPGHWTGGEYTDYMYLPDGRPVIDWRGQRVMQYLAAWYSRPLNIPASCAGKKIELEFEHLKGAYSLYIDGREILKHANDDISRPRIDATAFLKPGKTHTLSIRISGMARSRLGIFGPAYLNIYPESNLGLPSIETSVSKKKLTVSFPYANVPAGGSVELKIRSVKTGKVLFEKKNAFKKELSFSWLSPELWSPAAPNLLFADFTLRDASGKILDGCTRRFGFREFHISGGKYYLNGIPIILKMETGVAGYWTPNFLRNPELERVLMLWRKKMNLNSMYFSEDSTSGTFDLADEIGLMVIPKIVIFSHAVWDKATDQFFTNLEKTLIIERNSRRYANHPSQIGFLIDVWYNFHTGTHNPHFVGMDHSKNTHREIQPDGSVKTVTGHDPNIVGMYLYRKNRLDRACGIYRKVFPGTECFTGGSGQVGNTFATHMYHTWGAPLSELRTFFETWSLNRELPLFIGEMTQPYIGSFHDLENFFGGGLPFYSENAARILGNKAYSYSSVYVKRPFHDRTHEGFKWHWTEKRTDYTGLYLFPASIYGDVLSHYLREMHLPWRIMGVNGFGNFEYSFALAAAQTYSLGEYPLPSDYSSPIYKPSTFTHFNASYPIHSVGKKDPGFRPSMPFAPFARSMDNLSMYILHGGKDIYLQDTAYFSGEKISKGIVLLNDFPEKRAFRVRVKLRNAQNRVITETAFDGMVEPAHQKIFPVSFDLPEVAKREEWKLSVTAELANGGKTMRDVFDFRVFPRVSVPAMRRKIHVFDPEGLLVRYLKKNGVKFEKLSSSDRLPENGVLLIGRGALSSMKTIPDFNELANKGLTTVIFEQAAKASSELMPVRARTAFINAKAHPVFEGLSDTDFTNFRGAHSLAPAYGKALPNETWTAYGNRNMLASSVFRRPPHGNYRSLLVSGFDLFQTPLLEYVGEKGVVIASQLDLAERFEIDPVVARFTANLLSYADNAGIRSGRTVAFAGKDGRAWLKKMGVKTEFVEDLSDKSLKNVSVLIVTNPDFSALKKYRFELVDFVFWGGKVIYIQNGKTFDPSWLPFTMNLKETTARGALPGRGGEDSVWTCGWDANDLYWHEKFKVPVFAGYPEEFDSVTPAVAVRGKKGSGEFIFVSITPEAFGNTPASAKTDRFISAILTASGAKIETCVLPIMQQNIMERKIDLGEMPWEFAFDPENKGLRENWHKGAGSGHWLKGLVADGVEVRVGQYFENFTKEYDGYAWYRLTLDVPKNMRNGPFYFIAGAIDDFDEVYLNGKLIGKTGKETPKWWEAIRIYRIPENLLKPGKNFLAVRVFDDKGSGGITRMPVMISNTVPKTERGWKGPFPQGSVRDYEYKSDIVRMY